MINMEIQKPYLLFLGDAHDILAAKVAIGIKQWHPEYCVGQFRMEDCHADCQLPDMDIATAKAAGAKTLVIGVANRGGIISDKWISILTEALEAGMDLASGLHNRLTDVPTVKNVKVNVCCQWAPTALAAKCTPRWRLKKRCCLAV